MPGRSGKRILTIDGTLEAWTPAVGEPLLWCIHEAGRPGPEGVHPLLDGDLLVVRDAAGVPVWVGQVEFDFETALRPDPLDPSGRRQAIGGYWVHGVQKGEDPAVWARMFFEHRPATVNR